MCGLVYYKSFTGLNMVEEVIWRYRAQRTRGTEGFGFYIPSLGKLTHSPSEDRILELLQAEEAPEVLYHHRMPTSTKNVENACHPFSTGDFFSKRYVLVHNGVIHNPLTLKAQHERMSIEYTSVQPDGKFNDSEALLWDVALYLEGQQPKLTAEGSIAFIVVEHDASGRARKIHFGRNTSPLYLQIDEKRLALASEAKWKENDSAEMIMPHFLHTFAYSSRNLTIRPLEVPTWSYTKSYPPTAPAASRVAPGASVKPSSEKNDWQKPSYSHFPYGAKSGASSTAHHAGFASRPHVHTSPEPAKKIILTPEIVSTDPQIEEDSIRTVQRFIDKYSSYDDAADNLKLTIGRLGRTLREMEKLQAPRPKTIKKYAKLLKYHRVLILAEEHIFDLMTDMAETDNRQMLLTEGDKS